MLIWESSGSETETTSADWFWFDCAAFGIPVAVLVGSVLAGSVTGVTVLIGIGLVTMALSKGLNREVFMALDVFSDSRIEHIAEILFCRAVVNHHKEDAGKVNWPARAHELWKSYKKTGHGTYLSYVEDVTKVVRCIEAQGCEIRIVQ